MSANAFPAINLVSYRRAVRRLVGQKKDKYTKLSIMMLVGFLAIFVPVLLVRFTMTMRRNSLNSDIEILSQNISDMKAQESKYTLLLAKTTAYSNLTTQRVAVQPRVVDVYSILPEGASIDQVAFGEGGKVLKVTVSAADVLVVGDLLERMSEAVGSRFDRVNFDSTRRNEDGSYKVSMEIHFEI